MHYDIAIVGSKALFDWALHAGDLRRDGELGYTNDIANELYDVHDWPKDTDYICSKEAFNALMKVQLQRARDLAFCQPTRWGMAMGVSNKFHSPLDTNTLTIYEAEFTGRNSTSQEIFDHILTNSLRTDDEWRSEKDTFTYHYADLNTLYLLKMSHRYLKNSPHFIKTMNDIRFMRSFGAYIENKDLLLRRQEETLEYGHPNLKRTKKDFFVTSGELVYTYDHDSLHEAVAHKERPMYTYYAMDGEEVMSDRSKFDALYYAEKIWGVLEEAYVLALERSVIPFDNDPDEAFMMALEKVCTSITSGWFREFAWEHYNECLAVYRGEPVSYIEKFKTGLENGIVKRIEND